MTLKLSFCLKAATTLNDQDLATITDGIEAYVRAGMATELAEVSTVDDMLAAVQAEHAEMVGLLKAQHPDLFKADRPALPKKADDLDAMFDDIMGESAPVERVRVVKNAKGKPFVSVDGDNAAGPFKTEAAAQAYGESMAAGTAPRKRSAPKAAGSAVVNTAKALDNAIDGLGKLFGGAGKLGSGLSFDEDTYAKAKPLFVAAVANLKDAASDLREAMRTVIEMITARFGRDTAQAMKPYIVRFVSDVRDGKVTLTQEKADGSDDTGAPGADTLDEVAPGEGAGPEGEGAAGGSDSGSGVTSPTRNPGARGPRVSGTRSGGSGSTSVRAPSTRGRGRKQSERAGGTGDDGSAVPAGDGRDALEPISAGNLPALNFRITPDVRLGKGGEVEKFNDNLKAIRTLKAIEAEHRRATPDEQRALARYVGWGGLANAFESRDTGKYKEGWEARGKELAELLSDKELQLARRSTLDAHFTSEDVVTAMWSAARHLGFRGGMTLESSMGPGNFLGLIPDDLAGNTRFIGVEYDSLTARIATLLYPQETVLNSGFQKVPLPDGTFDLNIGNPPFGEQSLRFQYKPELNGASIHNQFIRGALDALKPGGLQIQVVSRYLMDKLDKSDRVALAKKGKLLGAIRLPDTAFKENARTEVVTDILFFQRLTAAEEAEMQAAFGAAGSKEGKSAADEMERRRLAAGVPKWVETTTIADPLGGEARQVNSYFKKNPHMILGTLERSGSMQFNNDITVRFEKGASLPQALANAIQFLPNDVAQLEPDAIANSIEGHKLMSDALRIALSGQERGSITIDTDGKLQQVVEKENARGEFLLARRELSADSPWSDQLLQTVDGTWYKLEVKKDAEGKSVKVLDKDGRPTRTNLVERTEYKTDADVPASMKLGQAKFERLKLLVGLRDLMVKQINLETEDAPAARMEGNRKQFKAAYDAFVAAHGLISDPANTRLVDDMPDGALVQALEDKYRPAISALRAKAMGEQPREAKADPAPILTRRVIPKYVPATTAESAPDALQINLAESGKINLARIAELLGTDEAGAIAQLAETDHPLIFKDPETNTWETRAVYLSGQVKRKLVAARATGMRKNADELEKVQPEPIGPENVTALLGSTWVPPDVYAEFFQHMTGQTPRITFNRTLNRFTVRMPGKSTEALNEQWGGERIRVETLIDNMINTEPVRVYDHTDDGPKVNVTLTELAQIKAGQIANEYQNWVFADAERRTKLVDVFNEKFNTRANRQHDGSHLVLPGKVPDVIIRMRRHQKNAIWRGITERFMLMDHVVGAGKTFTAIARAMERRRMGLSKKPMIVVPNHMVEQFTIDTYRLYPGAKVLSMGKRDLEKKNRRKAFAKIAAGDHDIIIVPHSSFAFIDISQDTEERYLEAELKAAEQAIKDAEAEDPNDGGFRKSPTVKQAERLRDKLTARMDRIKGREKADRLLSFEQLGVDDLTVDEAHEFKNLFYSSKLSDVKGMGNPTGSQKAYDLYNKVRVLRESPTGTVTFMTGTPISNSAVEMYNMMRYLAADQLSELGLEHFDAWRAQFVSTDPGWEADETGRLKEVRRLGRTWSNMRSLMDLYYSFTDSVGNDDIKAAYREDNPGKEFPIPRVKGGDRESVVIQPTPAQDSFLKTIIDGFNSLPDITDPYERNIARLRLMDRARKISLDVRAAEPSSDSTEPGGKLEKVASEAKAIYDQFADRRGTQLIFLDRSVPKAATDKAELKVYDALLAQREAALAKRDEEAYRKANDKIEVYDANAMEAMRAAQNGGWNAYQQIKDNLIKLGVPANEIRFIQEANNDAQKQALFDAVNDGSVRVLIGSTQRMGAGTNVQKRLVGLHHADVTWKPSDIEQREGRIIRQGNLFATPEIDGLPNPLYDPAFEVQIKAYATERTIDAKMWGLNSAKLRTINGIRKYDGAFQMEFEDEESVSMAEMAALASGDPLLMERVKLDSEIRKLEILEDQHRRKSWGVQNSIDSYQRNIKEYPAKIAAFEAQAKRLTELNEALAAKAAKRTVTIDGKVYDKAIEARVAADAAATAQQAGNDKARYSVTINGKKYTNKEGISHAISEGLGDFQPFEAVIGGETFTTRTDAQRKIAEMLAREANLLGVGATVQVNLGTFAGQKLEADVSLSMGHKIYRAELTVTDADGRTLSQSAAESRDNPDYNTGSLQKAVHGLDFEPHVPQYSASNYRDTLERSKRELPEFEAKKGAPFALAGELAEKRDRLEEVTKLLAGTPAAALYPDLRDAQAEEWDMANPTGWPNVPEVKFSEDFADTEVLPLPEVIEAGPVPSQDAAAVALIEKAFRGKVAAFKDLTITALPRVRKPGAGASAIAQERFAAADLAEKLFGKRVVFFSANIPFANGMQVDYVPGSIFVSESTTRPMMAVLGHELLHSMSQDHPELYRKLGDRLRGMLENPGRYGELLNKRRATKGLPALSFDKLREELIADIVGDNFTDPAFWRQMSAGQPSLFGRVLRVIRDFLDNLLAKLKAEKPYNTAQYLNDVQGARDAVVEAMRQFANSPKTAAAATTVAAEANLSENETNQTDRPEFKRWFGESKVVDADGKPLVVYHGTASDFAEFKTSKYEGGIYFTPSVPYAAGRARVASLMERKEGGDALMPVYLSMKNPAPSGYGVDRAKAEGFDGLVRGEGNMKEFVVFKPEQIKSAIGNSGAFDPNNPSINLSESGGEGNFAWHLLTDPKSVGEQLQQHFGRELASVTPLEVVDGAVLGALQNDEVRRAVVEALPVDVVNVLADYGLTAERLLSQPDVLGNTLPVDARSTVARGLAGATQLVGARLRTALRRVLSTDTGRRDEEVLPAVRASDLDPSVVVRLLSGARGDEALGAGLAIGEPAARDGAKAAVPGKDDAGVRGELSLAKLALFLNRHDAIVRGDSDNVVEKFVAPDAAGGLPMFSLRHTPEEEAAMRKAGIDSRTRLQRASDRIRRFYPQAQAALQSNWARQFQQGALDQFTGIRQAVTREIGALPTDQDPYVAARLANGGASSVMRGLLMHGQAKWAANGQHLEKIEGTEGLLDILKPLGADLNDFFSWMIGNRAARLMQEGRENNFTPEDIKALQGLNKGKEAEFRRAALAYAAFKRSVLDVAQGAGLLDPESRKVWDQADYIPFYREIDEKAVFGATGKKGLAGQSSGIRTLKGGEAGLNDPMENILMNFSRLIDASLKNKALAKTISVLQDAGSDIVTKVGYDMARQVIPASEVRKQLEAAGTPDQVLDIIPPEAFDGMAKMWAIQAPTDPDVVRVMVGGKPQFYKVNDPLLLKSLTSFVPFDFPGLGLARTFKRVLTGAVTATPEFMARNWIRDSMAAQLIGRTGFNPWKSIEGIKKSYTEDGGFEAMLFAGASFQSGQVNAGDPTGTASTMRRALRKKGFDASSRDAFMASIIDSPVKWWEAYKHVGESIENANREAIYEATLKRGGTATEAAYESKDLMDFTLRGSSPVYQVMADVLPFFNARVQGLYRAGRADPKRLVKYGMLMAVASIALAIANAGNPDYDELPDWDKDTSWHVWINGQHFRIPKPFELGVIFATMPERMFRYAMSNEAANKRLAEILGVKAELGSDSGKKFAHRVFHNIWDQLKFDPRPQIIKPAIESLYNFDSFRDRPIENMGDEGKLPSYRFSRQTSATAVAAVQAISPLADAIGLSPKKLEHLVGGYLGTMGLYALGLADIAVRAAKDEPPQPAKRLDEYPLIRAFYRQSPAASTVFETDLYNLRTQIEETYKSVRALRKSEREEEADALEAKNEKLLDARKAITSGAKRLASLNKQREAIYADREMIPKAKRAALDEILREKAEVAKDTMQTEEVRNAN